MRLSDFELDVMQRFWRDGVRSAPEVHQAIANTRAVTYSTVKTIIDRLERKGALKRTRQDGRTIFYEAAASPDAVKQTMLERFVAHVFAGDRRPLLSHLLKDEELTPEEYRYLEGLLARHRSRRKAEVEGGDD